MREPLFRPRRIKRKLAIAAAILLVGYGVYRWHEYRTYGAGFSKGSFLYRFAFKSDLLKNCPTPGGTGQPGYGIGFYEDWPVRIESVSFVSSATMSVIRVALDKYLTSNGWTRISSKTAMAMKSSDRYFKPPNRDLHVSMLFDGQYSVVVTESIWTDGSTNKWIAEWETMTVTAPPQLATLNQGEIGSLVPSATEMAEQMQSFY